MKFGIFWVVPPAKLRNFGRLFWWETGGLVFPKGRSTLPLSVEIAGGNAAVERGTFAKFGQRAGKSIVELTQRK